MQKLSYLKTSSILPPRKRHIFMAHSYSYWAKGSTAFDQTIYQGSYPFSETFLQDFSGSQIYFSRTPKCTIMEAINPYEIEIQK